jgi:hypothetical protein
MIAEGGLVDRERGRVGRPGRSGEESIERGGELGGLSDRLLFFNFEFRSGEEAS